MTIPSENQNHESTVTENEVGPQAIARIARYFSKERYRFPQTYDVIGQGGMGRIVQLREGRVGRVVAAKFLRPDREEDWYQEKLFAEARITGLLQHPGIVPIYDMGIDADGRPFFTMKKIQGMNLRTLIDILRVPWSGLSKEDRAEKQLIMERFSKITARLDVFRKVCDAVAFAHAHPMRVIHRDLKPENIMVGEFGEVLVMDWGMAKPLGNKVISTNIEHEEPLPSNQSEIDDSPLPEGMTMEGAFAGTLGYAPPEQLEGRLADINELCDVYALGGILFHLLTLETPIPVNLTGSCPKAQVSASDTSSDVCQKEIPLTDGDGDSATVSAMDPRKLQLENSRDAVLSFIRCRGVLERVSRQAQNDRFSFPEAMRCLVQKALEPDHTNRLAKVADMKRQIDLYVSGFPGEYENASAWKHLVHFIARHRAASIATILAILVLSFATAVFIGKLGAEKKTTLAERDKAKEMLVRSSNFFAQGAREAFLRKDFNEAMGYVSQALKADATNTLAINLAFLHLTIPEKTEVYPVLGPLQLEDWNLKGFNYFFGQQTKWAERDGKYCFELATQDWTFVWEWIPKSGSLELCPGFPNKFNPFKVDPFFRNARDWGMRRYREELPMVNQQDFEKEVGDLDMEEYREVFANGRFEARIANTFERYKLLRPRWKIPWWISFSESIDRISLIITDNLDGSSTTFKPSKFVKFGVKLNISPDGKLIFLVDHRFSERTGLGNFFDRSKGSRIASIKDVEWASFSPDGRHVAIFGEESRILRLDDWKQPGIPLPVNLTHHNSLGRHLNNDSLNWHNFARWSDDGSTLAIAGNNKMISVFQFSNEGIVNTEELDVIEKHYPLKMPRFSVSRNGSLVAIYNDGEGVTFWEKGIKRPPPSNSVSDDYVKVGSIKEIVADMSLSPDDKFLATVTRTGALKIWNVMSPSAPNLIRDASSEFHNQAYIEKRLEHWHEPNSGSFTLASQQESYEMPYKKISENGIKWPKITVPSGRGIISPSRRLAFFPESTGAGFELRCYDLFTKKELGRLPITFFYGDDMHCGIFSQDETVMWVQGADFWHALGQTKPSAWALVYEPSEWAWVYDLRSFTCLAERIPVELLSRLPSRVPDWFAEAVGLLSLQSQEGLFTPLIPLPSQILKLVPESDEGLSEDEIKCRKLLIEWCDNPPLNLSHQ